MFHCLLVVAASDPILFRFCVFSRSSNSPPLASSTSMAWSIALARSEVFNLHPHLCELLHEPRALLEQTLKASLLAFEPLA